MNTIIKKTFSNTFLPLILSTPWVNAVADEIFSTEVSLLTMDSALTIAKNTIKTCRKNGAQISVTVVDRFGNIQAQLRDTLAAPISVPISFRKAKTAANFNSHTSQLKHLEKSPLNNIENLLILIGGVPINAGGVFYGAVGVSGSTGEMDQLCAEEGANSLNDELEMQ